MTPVAEIQVIEGVGEQWKPSVNNNNNITADSVASTQLTNGKVNEEEDDGSVSSKNDDVDSEDSQGLPSCVQTQIPVTIYSTDYVNGVGNNYSEAFANGDVQANGFHEPQLQQGEDAISTESLTPEELARLVRHQFEYYFSRENLSNDVYLVSQMDDDQYVSIPTVAGFKQIKKLTSDLDFIVDSLKESPYIQLDATCSKVRANMKRCIVIVREIPESTPIEEVQKLFTSEKCPKWTSCEFVNNDSWYITFASEEDAQKAYGYIRQDVRTFQGRPIMARIKAKTLLSRTVFMPKNGARTDGLEQAQSPFAGPPPFAANGFAVRPPVFQQSPYQYYVPTTAWLSGTNPQFYGQEAFNNGSSNFHANSYMSNGGKPLPGVPQRHFHYTGKSRQPNGKGGFHRENQLERPTDKETTQSSLHRRQSGSGGAGHPNVSFRRESEVPPRRQSLKKQDVPRFQRLRQDKERRQIGMESKKPEEQALHIDLAPENFPALPSPKSPSSEPSAEPHTEVLVTRKDRSSSTSSGSEIGDKVSEPVLSSEPLSQSLVRNAPAANITLDSRMSYAQMAQRPTHKASTKDLCIIAVDQAAGFKGQNRTKPSNKAKNSKAIANGIDALPATSKKTNAMFCDNTEFPAPSGKDPVSNSNSSAAGTAAVPNKPTGSLSDKNSYAAKSVQNLHVQPRKLDLSNRTRHPPHSPLSPSKPNDSNANSTRFMAAINGMVISNTNETTPPLTPIKNAAAEDSIESGTALKATSPLQETSKTHVNAWSR